jgi:hypothetical protein
MDDRLESSARRHHMNAEFWIEVLVMLVRIVSAGLAN